MSESHASASASASAGGVTEDAAAFRLWIGARGGVLGLDPGGRTIGVAVSDARRIVATPQMTLARARFTDAAATLGDIVERRGLCGGVVGLPRNMDGTEGPRAQANRAFARNLSRALDMPVLLWDERLSTVAAHRALLEADMSRKRRARVIDAVAAGYILQGALDRLCHMETRQDEQTD